MNFTTVLTNTLEDTSEMASDLQGFSLNKAVFSKRLHPKCVPSIHKRLGSFISITIVREWIVIRKRESLNISWGKFHPAASKLLKYISDGFAGKYIIFLEQNVNQTVLHLISFLNHPTQQVQNPVPWKDINIFSLLLNSPLRLGRNMC